MTVSGEAAMRLYSIDAEQALIGGLLIDPTAIDAVADALRPGDFFNAAHACIFRHILRMRGGNLPVDAVTLAEEIEQAGESALAGGLAYLGQLQVNTPTAANVGRHAAVIADKRRLRDLLAASGEIAGIARAAGSENAAERIDRAQAAIMKLTDDAGGKGEPVPIGAVLADAVGAIERRAALDGALSGLGTGFEGIDEITCGLQKGDLVIVAGRPSMGKTTFALNIAGHVGIGGCLAAVSSMEMSRLQLTERAIASIGRIDSKRLRSGRLRDEDYGRMGAALGRLRDAPLVIDDSPGLTVPQMRARCRRIAREHRKPLALAVIDYLQLMRGEGNNRNEELGDITRGLKLMARELDCPVVLLSQLSRRVEERADKRPILSDLRESGAIEQDADLVIMMYRDDYYHPDSPFKGLAEALIRKHRMGDLGRVPLVFQGEYSRFCNAERGAYGEAAARAEGVGGKGGRGFRG